MCFCCSVRLIDWKRTDDPWVEHARVFPTCSYLLLTKSKSFVVTVHQLIQKYSNLDCFNEVRIFFIFFLRTKKFTYQLFYRH
jgi:hypothetical protein